MAKANPPKGDCLLPTITLVYLLNVPPPICVAYLCSAHHTWAALHPPTPAAQPRQLGVLGRQVGQVWLRRRRIHRAGWTVNLEAGTQVYPECPCFTDVFRSSRIKLVLPQNTAQGEGTLHFQKSTMKFHFLQSVMLITLLFFSL